MMVFYLHFLTYKEGDVLRIDKYLKNSRLIKRRTIAKEACDQNRILLNDKPAKAGSMVKVNDIISLDFSAKLIKVKVLAVKEHVSKEDAREMYEVIED